VEASVIKHNNSQALGVGLVCKAIEKRLNFAGITAAYQITVAKFVAGKVQSPYQI